MFTFSPEAIALCLSMGLGSLNVCHDGPGGATFFALSMLAIRRGMYDWMVGCEGYGRQVDPSYSSGRKRDEQCPPPPGASCMVIGTGSIPGRPIIVSYLCREEPIS